MAEPARKAQSMERVGLEIAPRRPQSNIADSARPDLPCKTAENWFQKRGPADGTIVSVTPRALQKYKIQKVPNCRSLPTMIGQDSIVVARSRN